MIKMRTRVKVKGISGAEISAFMLNCTDADYQRWWPGTHLAFHTIQRRPGDLGNLVMFDEIVGGRRLRFSAVLTEVVPGRKLTWQMKKLVRLPGWLSLDFEDTADGVEITHVLSAGFHGIGRILDPLLRIFLPPSFEAALEEHARTEFQMLAGILKQTK